MNLTILGLLGRKRSGKDVIAAHMVKEHKFYRYSVIQWLRDLLGLFNAAKLEKVYPFLDVDPELNPAYARLPYGFSQEERDPDERFLLQDLAQQFREQDIFWFIDRLLNQIYRESSAFMRGRKRHPARRRIVISDLRMGSDIVALKRFAKDGWPFGQVDLHIWKVVRPSLPNDDTHETEQEVDFIFPSTQFDLVSNDGTVEDLLGSRLEKTKLVNLIRRKMTL